MNKNSFRTRHQQDNTNTNLNFIFVEKLINNTLMYLALTYTIYPTQNSKLEQRKGTINTQIIHTKILVEKFLEPADKDVALSGVESLVI